MDPIYAKLISAKQYRQTVTIDFDMGEVTLTADQALEAYGYIAPGEGFEIMSVQSDDSRVIY